MGRGYPCPECGVSPKLSLECNLYADDLRRGHHPQCVHVYLPNDLGKKIEIVRAKILDLTITSWSHGCAKFC
jgi:hypothetical protein